MTLNYVTLTLDLYDGSGNYPVSGTASFTPSAVLTDAGVEVVSQIPITVTFRAGSLPTVKLLATDNSGPLPAGWTWSVTFSGVTGAPSAFSFFLPYASGSTQVLSSQAPVGSGTAFQAYMPFPAATPVTLTDAATISVNAALANVFRVTLGGNRTMANPTNPSDGQALTIEVIQDGTGSRTLSWGSAYTFTASTPQPSLSTAAGDRDLISFFYDVGAAEWICTGYVLEQNGVLVTIAQGGTGQTTQQAAINALTGVQASGQYLRSNGTNAALSAIVAADLPYDSTAADIQPSGVQTAGAVGKPADAGHIHPFANTAWIPADNGLLAACGSVDAVSSTFTVSKGDVYMVKVPVRYAFTATTVWFLLTTPQGSGASSGTYVALLSSAGSLLSGSTSADCATQFSSASASVAISVNLGTPQSLSAGTFVWVAILSNLATTQPTFRTVGTATTALANVNLSAASYRAAVQGSGSTTTIASLTPSSNSASDLIWAGIS